MIKGILFDLDYTLIDRGRAFKEMLIREFSNYYEDKNFVNALVEDMNKFDKKGEVEREIAFNQLIDKYKLTEFKAKDLADKWSKESGSTIYLYDDVVDTLTQLKKKYKLGIITNGHYTSQKRKLDSINLYSILDVALVSEEAGAEKPDPRVFNYACQKLGLNNNECVYVGDSYTKDVIGALNSNITPIYVCRSNEKHDDVKTIYSLSELLNIF